MMKVEKVTSGRASWAEASLFWLMLNIPLCRADRAACPAMRDERTRVAPALAGAQRGGR